MDPTTRPKRADEMNRSDDDDDDYEAAKPLSAGPDGNECADDDGSTERRPDETDERNNSPSPVRELRLRDDIVFCARYGTGRGANITL